MTTSELDFERRRRARAVRVLVLAAALMVAAATFIPTNGGGRGGYPYAIFDTSVQRELQLFAAEPLVVALLAAAIALALIRRMPAFSAGLLVAFGVQTSILFLAHVGIAAFGNPQYNSFRPGGLLGLAGALLLIGAGALTLSSRSRARA